jgi:hypothetical protein
MTASTTAPAVEAIAGVAHWVTKRSQPDPVYVG